MQPLLYTLIIILAVILAIVLTLLLFWRVWFLRQPRRDVPKSGIVSPASGKLVRIIAFKNGIVQDVPKGLLGVVHAITKDVADEGQMLVIMLTPFDVHYQRAPVDGKVKNVTYTKGLFRNAVIGADKLCAFENEKNEMLFASKEGKVKVMQVAGVAARRIICYVKPGQKLRRGDVIGLINLGSQVILIMPKKKLKVKVGDHLTDGETVIA